MKAGESNCNKSEYMESESADALTHRKSELKKSETLQRDDQLKFETLRINIINIYQIFLNFTCV